MGQFSIWGSVLKLTYFDAVYPLAMKASTLILEHEGTLLDLDYNSKSNFDWNMQNISCFNFWANGEV